MKNTIRIFIIIVAAVLSTSNLAAPRSFILSADEWASPRSGERILSFTALRDLVTVWATVPEGSVIVIRYPGGDAGSLWASELSDWLVALGIASEHIRLTPGHARANEIELKIIEPRH